VGEGGRGVGSKAIQFHGDRPPIQEKKRTGREGRPGGEKKELTSQKKQLIKYIEWERWGKAPILVSGLTGQKQRKLGLVRRT